MSNPTMFFVPAILVVPLVTILSTAQTSLAEPAADECKTEPGSSAPPGSHWYYRVNRTDQRHCWYVGPEGAKVRSQAREAPSRSPTRTPQRENAVETARVISAPMELARKTPLEAASAESHRAAADFAVPSSDLPKTPELDARELTTTNGYTPKHEPTDAQEEMPLIWPVLTEAERTGLPDAARDSGPGPVLLVGALAMGLLCAGAIFKLARRHTQSYRRDRRVVPRRPRQLRPGQKMRAGTSKLAAPSSSFAGRSGAGARQRPVSVDPAHDIKASLRKVMDELQRVAA